jgi:hypothetical protein
MINYDLMNVVEFIGSLLLALIPIVFFAHYVRKGSLF